MGSAGLRTTLPLRWQRDEDGWESKEARDEVRGLRVELAALKQEILALQETHVCKEVEARKDFERVAGKTCESEDFHLRSLLRHELEIGKLKEEAVQGDRQLQEAVEKMQIELSMSALRGCQRELLQTKGVVKMRDAELQRSAQELVQLGQELAASREEALQLQIQLKAREAELLQLRSQHLRFAPRCVDQALWLAAASRTRSQTRSRCNAATKTETLESNGLQDCGSSTASLKEVPPLLSEEEDLKPLGSEEHGVRVLREELRAKRRKLRQEHESLDLERQRWQKDVRQQKTGRMSAEGPSAEALARTRAGLDAKTDALNRAIAEYKAMQRLFAGQPSEVRSSKVSQRSSSCTASSRALLARANLGGA